MWLNGQPMQVSRRIHCQPFAAEDAQQRTGIAQGLMLCSNLRAPARAQRLQSCWHHKEITCKCEAGAAGMGNQALDHWASRLSIWKHSSPFHCPHPSQDDALFSHVAVQAQNTSRACNSEMLAIGSAGVSRLPNILHGCICPFTPSTRLCRLQ